MGFHGRAPLGILLDIFQSHRTARRSARGDPSESASAATRATSQPKRSLDEEPSGFQMIAIGRPTRQPLSLNVFFFEQTAQASTCQTSQEPGVAQAILSGRVTVVPLLRLGKI